MSTHVVQLFDTLESRASGAAAFVQAGLASGDAVVVFATAPHWKAIEERLGGQPAASAVAPGQLMVFDAHETLGGIMTRGLPDRARFSARIGSVVLERCSHGRVRAYGELVDVLAEEGNFAAAIALERLWNDLLAERPFALMCGYCSTHFGNALASSALAEICACHSRVDTAPDDFLGTFLIAESRDSRHTSPGASFR